MEKAIQRFLAKEAAGSFGAAFLSFLGALAALALTYLPLYFVGFMILDSVGGKRTAAEWGHWMPLGIIALLFLLDRGRGAELDAAAIPRVTFGSAATSPETATAGARIISDVILAAPRAFKAALRYIRRGLRIKVASRRLIAPLSVLSAETRSLEMEELAVASGAENAIELYEDLRLLTGIMWLGEGGMKVKLSDELHAELNKMS